MTTSPRKFIGMNRLSDFFFSLWQIQIVTLNGTPFFIFSYSFGEPFQPRACGALPSKLFFHWFEQQQQKLMEKKEKEKNTNFMRNARALFLRTNWSPPPPSLPPPPQSSGSPFSGFCPLVRSNVYASDSLTSSSTMTVKTFSGSWEWRNKKSRLMDRLGETRELPPAGALNECSVCVCRSSIHQMK